MHAVFKIQDDCDIRIQRFEPKSRRGKLVTMVPDFQQIDLADCFCDLLFAAAFPVHISGKERPTAAALHQCNHGIFILPRFAESVNRCAVEKRDLQIPHLKGIAVKRRTDRHIFADQGIVHLHIDLFIIPLRAFKQIDAAFVIRL